MMLKDKAINVGKRWQKNGMDRYYINYSDLAEVEVDGFTMYAMFNRRQRQNMKIYFDAVKDELVVTTADAEQKAFVEKVIMAL